MAKTQEATTPKTVAEQADPKTGELAVKDSTGALSTEVGEIDFAADAGAGLEGTQKDDYAIPFLAILQGLSPQVVDGLEGARPGLIMDSIDLTFSDRVVVVPCAFARRFIEWAPRNKGGGFRGEHLPLDVESGKIGEEYVDTKSGMKRLGVKVTDKDGATYFNELKDTRSHYVLLVKPDGTFKPCVISFSSTQVKKSKRWLALISGTQLRNAAGAIYTPPSYAMMYEMSAVKEQNDQGSWFGWSMGKLGAVRQRDMYDAAKAFNALVTSGQVKTSYEQEGDVVSEAGGSEQRGSSF